MVRSLMFALLYERERLGEKRRRLSVVSWHLNVQSESFFASSTPPGFDLIMYILEYGYNSAVLTQFRLAFAF